MGEAYRGSPHAFAFCTLRVILKGLAREPPMDRCRRQFVAGSSAGVSQVGRSRWEKRIATSATCIVFCTLREILKGLAREPPMDDAGRQFAVGDDR